MSKKGRGGGHGGGGGGGGGHDAGGGLRWLLTYSDVVTLLLALFVFLYSVSSADSAKVAAFSSAWAQLFGVGSTPFPSETPSGSDGAVPLPGKRREREGKLTALNKPHRGSPAGSAEEETKALKNFKKSVEQQFPELLAEGKLTIFEREAGLVLRIQDATLFDLGSAQIRNEAKPILAVIADKIVRLPNNVRVEGHTDNLPIRSARFSSNWELSGARAASVVEFFVKVGGLEPTRLSLAGYGEFRPIAENLPRTGSELNRRVEILILSQFAGQQEEGEEEASAAETEKAAATTAAVPEPAAAPETLSPETLPPGVVVPETVAPEPPVETPAHVGEVGGMPLVFRSLRVPLLDEALDGAEYETPDGATNLNGSSVK